MTSPIAAVMDQISADWAAIVPEDRVTIRYAELTGREAQAGVTGDRRFAWGPPQRLGTTQVTGDAELVEWTIVAVVRLSSAGRGRSAASQSAAHELSALVATVVNRASWPSGVLDMQERDTSIEYDATSGDAILTIAFTALTSEHHAFTYTAPLSVAEDDEEQTVMIEPDPNRTVGTTTTTIGTIDLVAGDYSVSSTLWNDRNTGGPATISVRVLSPSGTELALMETSSTVSVEVTDTLTVSTDPGIHTITATTSADSGVGVVELVIVTREVN